MMIGVAIALLAVAGFLVFKFAIGGKYGTGGDKSAACSAAWAYEQSAGEASTALPGNLSTAFASVGDALNQLESVGPSKVAAAARTLLTAPMSSLDAAKANTLITEYVHDKCGL
ncbi:hypothetical protein [Nocardioides baekrokdamisoli]|uniref:hypothetical protein n=1 Tax=Nocardioides baekrokdamisoli TaxID=1804624 RepID=UPI000F77A044|nr:hypothetical protein [Nocardioides baekrokdamisoli]